MVPKYAMTNNAVVSLGRRNIFAKIQTNTTVWGTKTQAERITHLDTATQRVADKGMRTLD
jgi:hypothetical protein